jgi:hypothetical protein
MERGEVCQIIWLIIFGCDFAKNCQAFDCHQRQETIMFNYLLFVEGDWEK